jgi:S-layer homology domain
MAARVGRRKREDDMLQPTTEELLARIETLEGRQRTQGRRRGARMALSVIALAALLAVPIGVFASHSFTDVPDSNTFHTQIGRVKGAGITAGCTATTYCPDANVTRGQMAAFLARTGGRVAYDLFGNTAVAASASGFVLSTITLKPGDVTGGTAYVKIDAGINAFTGTVTGCPCQTGFTIYVNNVAQIAEVYTSIENINVSGVGYDAVSITKVYAVPTGTAATIELRANNGGSGVTVWGDLAATYIPFAGDGTNAVAAPALAPKPGSVGAPSAP